jgi:hypothetical protein
MIAAGNHQLHFRHLFCQDIERFDHQLETFVGSPFPESKNAVNGISPPPEIRKFRTPGQDSMSPQVNIVAAVFVVENFPVARH